MKVLHVVDTLSVGGAETWLLSLMRYWRGQGADAPRVDILATSGKPGDFDDEACELGARIFYLPFTRTVLPSFAYGWRMILRHQRYDALHDHQDYASGWHLLLGLGALPPVRVTHVHNPWLHMDANYAVGATRKAVAVAGKRLVERLGTHVCGTSAEVLDQYEFARSRHLSACVLHCGISVEAFGGAREADRHSVRREFQWEAGTRIILFAGRLDQALEIGHPKNHKNSWFAVNVAIEALKREPRIRLLMVGAGDAQRLAIEQRLSKSGLAGKFRLAGVRHDIPRLMRAADALLFPSTQEGLGMAAVEAQAAGLPVVASDTVPRAAIVVPGLYTALPLSEPIEVWAEAVRAAVETVRPTPAMCARAVNESPFAIETSARRLESIYRGAV